MGHDQCYARKIVTGERSLCSMEGERRKYAAVSSRVINSDGIHEGLMVSVSLIPHTAA